MSRKDPYEILGVGRNAGEAEVKSAYRKLAKQHHPDRNPGDKSAEQRFKEVQAAYEVLGDKDRRAQYDQFGEGGPTPDFSSWNAGPGRRGGAARAGGPSGPGGVDIRFGDLGDLSSIFEQFFGRVGPRSRRRGGGAATAHAAPRGADIEYTLDLTLEDAARGAVRQVELIVSGGSNVGAVSSARPVASTEKIQFRIPPAVADGQRIRVKGKGQAGHGERGDLMIRCRVLPHAYFRREDLDISLDLPLSIAEATLGAKVDVPTLDGPTTITVPAGTSSGSRLRLRGRGIQDPRSGRSGDMYAVVRVMVPRSATPEVRDLIERLDTIIDQHPRRELAWRLER